MTDTLSPLTACEFALCTLEDHDKIGRELDKKYQAAQELLAATGTCPHPVDRRRTYRWEHDNGYGRQSMWEGYRCQLCGAEDPWKDWDRR